MTLIKYICIIFSCGILLNSCSALLSIGEKFSPKVGIAKSAYMAALVEVQKQVCCGDLLTIEYARRVRESNTPPIFLEFQCDKAKEHKLVCQ